MKKVLLVALVLLVVGIVSMVAMCKMAGNRLKGHVDELLVAAEEGRWQDAYAMTGAAFRATNAQEDLRAYLEPRMKAVGPYKGLGSVKGFEVKRGTSDPYDDAITVDVMFEQGTYPGTFKFVTEDEQHRFFGITLEIPNSKLPQAQRADLEARARELVQLFADGQLVALYDRFAPALKEAWPAEKYQEQLSGLRGALGPFQKATLVDVKEDNGAHEVQLTAEFLNAVKTVRIKLADARGTWVPVGFFIGTPGSPAPGGAAESEAPDGPPAEKEAGQDK